MSFSQENATCPGCGRPLPPGTTYCPSCGAAVSYGTYESTIPSKYSYPPTNYGGVNNPYETEAPIPPPPPPPQRRKVWVWLVLVVIVVMVAVYGGIRGLVSSSGNQTANVPATPQSKVTTTAPKPTATPIPLPLIAESHDTEASPACENGLPHDLAWYVYYVNITCLPNNSGVKIDQKVNNYEPILGLRPEDDQHRFASNYSTGVTLTNIAQNVCAGLFIGVTTKIAQDFLFLICGDGDWYISRAGTSGLPYIISQNTSTTKEPKSDHYTIEVAVAGSGFQMFVSGGTGQVHSGQDAELTETQVIGIVFGEKGAVISNANSTFLASITAKDFYYEQQ